MPRGQLIGLPMDFQTCAFFHKIEVVAEYELVKVRLMERKFKVQLRLIRQLVERCRAAHFRLSDAHAGTTSLNGH